MKHTFLSVIVTCIFCLTILPVSADDIKGVYALKDTSTQVVNVVQQKAQPTLQNTTEKKMKAYPNPIGRGSLLTIEMPNDRGELTIFMYNTVGKVIQTFKTSDKKLEFNAPDVSGIYLLRFVEKQKVIAVEKIVVKE